MVVQIFGLKSSQASRAAERFFKERRVTIQIAHNPYGLEDVGMAGSRWATPCAVQFYGVGLTAASVAR